jgi:hypothetical protein
MKRTSVQYTVTSSYSHNPNTKENQQVKRNSCLVLLVGILLIIGVIILITKNLDASLLASAALIPGNPFDEGQQDDDTWRLVLGIIGVIILLVGIPLSFILA